MPSLTSIFGRAKMTYRGSAASPSISECCVNRRLMPRWRGPEVMEDDSLAMGFVCHRCGREFLPGDVKDRRLIRGVAAPVAAAVATAPADHAAEPMEPSESSDAPADDSEDETVVTIEDEAAEDEPKA